MSFPQWAQGLSKLFKHQLTVESGVQRWLRNTCFADVGITVNWNLLSIHVQNNRVTMWDYIKVKMMSGASLEHFQDDLSDFMACDYFRGALRGENVIDYLIRTNGGRV